MARAVRYMSVSCFAEHKQWVWVPPVISGVVLLSFISWDNSHSRCQWVTRLIPADMASSDRLEKSISSIKYFLFCLDIVIFVSSLFRLLIFLVGTLKVFSEKSVFLKTINTKSFDSIDVWYPWSLNGDFFICSSCYVKNFKLKIIFWNWYFEDGKICLIWIYE